MREIKFRVRDRQLNKWIDLEQYQSMGAIEVENDGTVTLSPRFRFTQSMMICPEAFEVMQYTGLKDKNGKEIYEGDIILKTFKDKPFAEKHKEKKLKCVVEYRIDCGDNFVGEKGVMKYWGAGFKAKVIDKADNKKYGCCDWSPFFECEVIGNIYDNPGLLKE